MLFEIRIPTLPMYRIALKSEDESHTGWLFDLCHPFGDSSRKPVVIPGIDPERILQ